jgi:hypothetical protein
MKCPLHHSDFITQKEHMLVKLNYSLTALQKAAIFIWETNPSVKHWSDAPKSVFDVMDIIQKMMRKDALKNADVLMREKATGSDLVDEWGGFSGTGGFYLSYELHDMDDDEISIGVDILVDPSVGSKDPTYVTEVVDELTS